MSPRRRSGFCGQLCVANSKASEVSCVVKALSVILFATLHLPGVCCAMGHWYMVCAFPLK